MTASGVSPSVRHPAAERVAGREVDAILHGLAASRRAAGTSDLGHMASSRRIWSRPTASTSTTPAVSSGCAFANSRASSPP